MQFDRIMPQPSLGRRPVIIVMGVAGCGKTTVGRALAGRLEMPFQEGDALHPPANVAKMAGGTPLTDDDRAPWLAAVAARIDAWREAATGGVITCSALKRAYRRVLVGDRPDVRLVYLRGDEGLFAARLAARTDHFMPASLLASQLATLEEPAATEWPIVVSAALPVAQLVDTLVPLVTIAARNS
jgi:carbohydrate kinase (thermoresistant glucokinase family)